MHRILLSFLLFCTLVVSAQVDSITVKRIEIFGNKTTKESIIFRELSFQINEKIAVSDTSSHVTQSQDNLFNTSLFNFTKVTFTDSLGHCIAKIDLQERWYLWPQVIIQFQERNFSEWWKNKNFSRIDYGLLINRNNFLGRNQTLQGQFYYGFTQKFGVKYEIPYLSKKQQGGLKIAASYATQNEIFTGLEDNQMIYTKNDSDIIYSDFTGVLEYTRRTGFYQLQNFALEYKQIRGRNELKDLSKAFFGEETSFLRYISLMYVFKIDKRFRKNYPLTGSFFQFKLHQHGLGDLDKSNLSITNIAFDYRKFIHLKNRHYFAVGGHTRIIPQESIPFRFKNGLGFSEYVRGYEPYVMFGQYTFLLKSNYKFELISPKKYTLPVIKKWKKFSKVHFAMYWNIYSDFGYVYSENNNQQFNNDLLIGVGTGIDWVTYYDMVIRTEFSINKNGESGFYLNFVAPI